MPISKNLANTLEKIGRFIVQYWYVDLTFAIIGFLLIYFSLRLKKSTFNSE